MTNTDVTLPALTNSVMSTIGSLTSALNIPRDVLASDDDISHAWKNLPRELKEIPAPLRDELIARMCVAVSAGLFDGAMNYVWNAAILQLRQKVRIFGLAVVPQMLQQQFEEKDLLDLTDSRLLELCLKLNLVDEDGYFFLDQCRSIRNNFSAAHPVMGNINDREFITFLNRCVRYALGDSSSPAGVDIAAFVAAIKGARFTDNQRDIWLQRLISTHESQRQALMVMVHGVYCDPAVSEPARLNSLDICTSLNDNFTSSLRSELINRHADYAAKGDEARHLASSQFFEKQGLLGLLNESEQHTIFFKSIDRLWQAHIGSNNFYVEPPFAERLLELTKQSAVPETVQEYFTTTVVAGFIGNGYGVSWSAEAKYDEIIRSFSPGEIATLIRVSATNGSSIYNRINSNGICFGRFKDALRKFEPTSIPSGVKAQYEQYLK